MNSLYSGSGGEEEEEEENNDDDAIVSKFVDFTGDQDID